MSCFCPLLLLLALGADEHDHSFALEAGNVIRLAVFLQICCEACEEQFSLLFEDDGASAEEDVGFHFVALLEELLRMFELEVIVVIVGLGSEPYFLDFLLFLVCFCFLLFLLLCVEELLIIHDPANGRISRCSNLDEVEILLICDVHSLLEGVDTGLYVVSDETNLRHTTDLVVNTIRILFDNTTTAWSGSNSCYNFSF